MNWLFRESYLPKLIMQYIFECPTAIQSLYLYMLNQILKETAKMTTLTKTTDFILLFIIFFIYLFCVDSSYRLSINNGVVTLRENGWH